MSVHHGGGVGIGNSLHAGMVVVADGTDEMAERLERVLTFDPGMGVDAARGRGLPRRHRRGRERRPADSADPRRVVTATARPAAASAISRRSRRPRGADVRRCGARRSATVDVLEDAYVLCDGRRRSRRSGGCATCGRARRRRRASSTVAGCAPIPGLVDCHTHPAFGGDRVDEFSLRAGGASYEELHAAGGGILSTVARDARRRRGRARVRPSSGTRAWMLRARHDDVRGRSRATGSTATPSSRRCERSATPGGIPTWLGAHAVPPEFADADAYLDFALAEVLPEAARARRSRRRLPRARRLRRDAGAALPRGVPRRRARAAAARRPVHGVAARSRSPIELGARSVDHLEATGDDGVRALAASDVVGVAAARRARSSSTGRCRRPGLLIDAGAAVALATDCNSGGSCLTESQALLCSRRTASELRIGTPAEALVATNGQRGPRDRPRPRPHRPPRARLPRRPRRSSTRPTGATSRTTSAVDVVAKTVHRGSVT